MIRAPPRSTLVPPTTLIRSLGDPRGEVLPAVGQPRQRGPPVPRLGLGQLGGQGGELRLRVGEPALHLLHPGGGIARQAGDRKSTRLNSRQAHISYADFSLKK